MTNHNVQCEKKEEILSEEIESWKGLRIAYSLKTGKPDA